MNGFCIIPEGSYNGATGRGPVYNQSNIKGLDKYLTYARNLDLGVIYLSTQYGVVFADEDVEYSKKKLYNYSLPERKVWSKIISEQVFRHCLNYSVSKVYLMINYKSVYGELISELQNKGIQVITPFMKVRN